MFQRYLSAIAAIGGIALILAVASLVVLPIGPSGYRDAGLPSIGLTIGFAMIGIAFGEIGTRQGPWTSVRTGHGIAIVSVVVAVRSTRWTVYGLIGWPTETRTGFVT